MVWSRATLRRYFQDKHPIERDLRSDRSPGRDRIERRHTEPRNVAGDEHRQVGIRAGEVDNAGQPQLEHVLLT